ncbi:MAG: Trypsin [Candidatus Hydrogenedentes bacterium ADurb.Bin101]|nr:MAG: Trypsin [Candidatus Hydrogenedentes bacterium ADurb.Bin101]
MFPLLTVLLAIMPLAVPAGEMPFGDCSCDKPEVTEISDVPWEPLPPVSRPKVIYGNDDRIDVYAETNPDKLTWAASTCALIYTSRLTENTDGSYTLSAPAAYLRYGLPPCDGEPFGNQPTAPYCSGFMVGPDLIVTAGHCYNSTSFSNTRFVFGFHMLDAATPRLTFAKEQVYRGIEIVSSQSTGSFDHCVVRVDRPIQAPGAQAFKIRRDGSIAPGEFVGVLGHPSGLPLKIAFGNTYVRNSVETGFFVANLDTYGGNSGSPVINAATGLLEGILVRGDTDFINRGTCFESNVVPADGGRGEDVTKATVFAEVVPEETAYSGTIAFDRGGYGCSVPIMITVIDADLAGTESILVTVETSSGDLETVELIEDAPASSRFNATVETDAAAAVFPGSAVLEVGHGDTVSVTYTDLENESGESAEVSATAIIDCYPPAIGGITLSLLGATQAQIQFTTDEPARGTLRYGASCGTLAFQTTGTTAVGHSITLSGLAPDTRYYYAIEAVDGAGNAGVDDNAGACYSFMTYSTQNHFTEYFNTSNLVDIEYLQVTYLPIDQPNRYQACISPVEALPVPPGGEIIPLADDGFEEILLPSWRPFNYYGLEYDRFFIGANGYITFGQGDSTYQALPSQHFLLPRISAVMCDLNPSLRGTVYFTQLSDRYAVTFENIPVYDGLGLYPPENSHTFQIELFFDGIIRVTWLEIAATRAIAGLSSGAGTPVYFSSIKISQFKDCGDITHEGDFHSADTSRDWKISLAELLRVIQFYNSSGFSCAPSTEDGYNPEGSSFDCTPHDSDYMAQDWMISLNELLRVIQFYNARGYRPQSGTEDGFQPIP